LPQHGVDKRRLAMIDVRDDCYVTEIHQEIVAAWVTIRENERASSRERQQARGRESEEEVLSQQTPVQALPGGRRQDPQGRTQVGA
jgi:hypothetical protein